MKKKSGDEILPLEVDPISGQYYITIPEWVVNELSWYEDTQIKINLDGQDVILTEHSED